MATSTPSRNAPLYPSIWRWHFYAGMIVAPFLLILSATGAIYLFNEEINNLVYPELRFVEPAPESVPVSHMIEAALAAYPGAAARIDLPADSSRSATVFVTPETGEPLRVSVDPGTGEVLGSLVYERTLVGFADTVHGTLMMGTLGDRIVELAASWTLVLLGAGLYLWWPRGGRRPNGVVFPQWSLRGRSFWRALHGPVGLWTGMLIAFLVVTGLPWAGVQGDLLQRASAALGAGYPASFRAHGTPESGAANIRQEGPWTLERAPVPQSEPPASSVQQVTEGSHAGHHAPPPTRDTAVIAGSDRIARQLAGEGLAGGYRLLLPGTANGVYTAYTYPDRPEAQRTFYFDRYSFAQIGPEVRYQDYGWAGRAIELGVAVHLGNYFGRANQIVMLIPCIGIWVLTISGGIMWWKRRPPGRLGAPARAANSRAPLIALGAAGLVMPLFGLSLLVMAAIDWAWVSARRRLATP